MVTLVDSIEISIALGFYLAPQCCPTLPVIFLSILTLHSPQTDPPVSVPTLPASTCDTWFISLSQEESSVLFSPPCYLVSLGLCIVI